MTSFAENILQNEIPISENEGPDLNWKLSVLFSHLRNYVPPQSKSYEGAGIKKNLRKILTSLMDLSKISPVFFVRIKANIDELTPNVFTPLRFRLFGFFGDFYRGLFHFASHVWHASLDIILYTCARRSIFFWKKRRRHYCTTKSDTYKYGEEIYSVSVDT